MTARQAEVQGWLTQAIEHHQAGRLVEAEQLYRRVLDAEPQSADAWHLLGVMAEQTGQTAIALQYIDEALKIAPDHGQFHYSRGVSLQGSDNPDDAITAYRQALDLSPGHVKAMENLAVALSDIGEDVQGETICREVLNLVPDSPVAHRNLGTILLNQGHRESALKHFEHLLSLDPADASARSKRYQILLALERFREGYADYAWRHHSADFSGPSPPKLMPLPSLGDRDVIGQKLVIVPEQGVGDEIFFASGLPSLMSKAASVLLLCDERLIPLFQRSFPDLDVRPAPPADRCRWPEGIDSTWLRCEAGDLPRIAFGDACPRPAAFLRPDPRRVRYWRDKLRTLPGRHIGIAWRGGADVRARRARSVSLEDLVPLMDRPDASFINLQYGGANHDLSAEIQEFNCARGRRAKLIELDELDTMNDLDEMAALALALDFVVTVDSAIAHLASAVGARTCVLLPPGGDWRWFHLRDDPAWYRNTTVMRRPAGEDWAGTIQTLIDWLNAADNAVTRADELIDDAAPDKQATADGAGRAAAPKASEKALLLNDTSAWYHWGCSCTSVALNEGLRANHATVNSAALLRNLRPETLPQSVDAFSSAALFKRFRRAHGWLIEAMEDADCIVINGEGTLHGVGHQAICLLYLAWIATDRLDRAVQIVNHSVYPLEDESVDEGAAISMYRKVYECVQTIVVREAASQAVLDAMGLPSRLGFDCLPLFAEQHGPDATEDDGPEKRIVIAGSVSLTPSRITLFADLIDSLYRDGHRFSMLLGARGFPAADDSQFAANLYSAVAGKLDIVLATSEFEWLRHIRDASLLISGRFHHSIAAACMRTPFAVIGSNTPKITGLMQVLSEQSPNPGNFRVIEDQRDALTAAVKERISAPAGFVLGNSALQHLRDLATENFSGR